jgi:hypothetical protein
MWCEFITTETRNVVWCEVCKRNAFSPTAGVQLRRVCKSAKEQIPGAMHIHKCGAGCQLTRLLSFIGNDYEAGCGCHDEARRMDDGATTADQTIVVMREEAAKRNFTFIESQVRWLIELAYTLSAEDRELNRREQIRLRAMRFGNQLLNGRQQPDASQQSL